MASGWRRRNDLRDHANNRNVSKGAYYIIIVTNTDMIGKTVIIVVLPLTRRMTTTAAMQHWLLCRKPRLFLGGVLLSTSSTPKTCFRKVAGTMGRLKHVSDDSTMFGGASG